MRRPTHNHLIPAIATHPGEVLKEELDARGMTQKELAEQMGRSTQIVNMIINGRKGISAETAVNLEKAFPEIPAEFWLNLDSAYRLDLVRIQQRNLHKAS